MQRLSWLAATVRLLTAMLLVAATPTPDRNGENTISVEQLGRYETLKLSGRVFHVQGLDIDANSIYVTSVDERAHRGFVHKFTLTGNLVAVADLTDGPRYHPGGISLQGNSLWVPVAEYRSHSTSRIIQLNAVTLNPVSSFAVADHIGAVTLNASRIYGANWDAERIYIFDRDGRLMAKRLNPMHVAYQDLKFVGDDLIASGIMPDRQTGAIDWLDNQSLSPRLRLEVGKTGSGQVWTREGMAIKDDKLYLLPDDGRDGAVEVYIFNLSALKAAAAPCIPIGERDGRCISRRQVVASR